MNSTGGIARFASRKKSADNEKVDNNPKTDNNNETIAVSQNDEFTDFNTSFDFADVDYGTSFGDFGSYLQDDENTYENPSDVNVDFNFLEQDLVEKEANDSKAESRSPKEKETPTSSGISFFKSRSPTEKKPEVPHAASIQKSRPDEHLKQANEKADSYKSTMSTDNADTLITKAFVTPSRLQSFEERSNTAANRETSKPSGQVTTKEASSVGFVTPSTSRFNAIRDPSDSLLSGLRKKPIQSFLRDQVIPGPTPLFHRNEKNSSPLSFMTNAREVRTPTGVTHDAEKLVMPPPPPRVTPGTQDKRGSSLVNETTSDQFNSPLFDGDSPQMNTVELDATTNSDCEMEQGIPFVEIYEEVTSNFRDFQDKEFVYSSSLLDMTVQLTISHAQMLEIEGEILDSTEELAALIQSADDAILKIREMQNQNL